MLFSRFSLPAAQPSMYLSYYLAGPHLPIKNILLITFGSTAQDFTVIDEDSVARRERFLLELRLLSGSGCEGSFTTTQLMVLSVPGLKTCHNQWLQASTLVPRDLTPVTFTQHSTRNCCQFEVPNLFKQHPIHQIYLPTLPKPWCSQL